MHIATHRALGKMICRCLRAQGFSPDRGAFLLGTVWPDLSKKYYAWEHTAARCKIEITENIYLLSSTALGAAESWRYSFRLGVLCHYLADYFCYAHTDNFTGDMKAHLRYEWLLATKTFAQFDPAPLPLQTGRLRPHLMLEQLEQMHHLYLAAAPLPERDLDWSYRISVQLCADVCRASATARLQPGWHGQSAATQGLPAAVQL